MDALSERISQHCVERFASHRLCTVLGPTGKSSLEEAIFLEVIFKTKQSILFEFAKMRLNLIETLARSRHQSAESTDETDGAERRRNGSGAWSLSKNAGMLLEFS